jgi:NAD(P)-dependent dehydrogenase (short-subunit alcohol dehydrogenase family)
VFGGLDVVVNNAGILRDRMVVSMTVDDWDDVMRVHLRGTFLMTNTAARYWRDRNKQGVENNARVINTSSASGLMGNVGQSNYGAAKAGIASFSMIVAAELGRYGITVNAVSPSGRTRMTSGGMMGRTTFPEGEFDPYDPDNVAPFVVWLGSAESASVTGRVFAVSGGKVAVLEGWREGPAADKGGRWNPAELTAVVPDLVARAAPSTVFQSRPKGS